MDTNKSQAKPVTSATNKKLAVVRVRGITGVKYDIDATLKTLRLYRKNYCVVVPETKDYLGMVRKIKDYVTWGEIDDQTYNTLLEKRKEEYKGIGNEETDKNKFFAVGGNKIKKVFRLNSPRKGYGRKGIKVSFRDGGALDYRGNKINDLINRMV